LTFPEVHARRGALAQTGSPPAAAQGTGCLEKAAKPRNGSQYFDLYSRHDVIHQTHGNELLQVNGGAMRLEICTGDDRFEASLSDRFTSADLRAFRELLAQIKISKCSVIVLDLANLDWIDSAGLGMLLLARDAALKDNFQLVLRSPQGNVKSLLKLGRFDTIFDMQF
jgi:anti-anti-sigma factor